MSLFPRVGPTRVGLTIDDLGRVRSCNVCLRVGLPGSELVMVQGRSAVFF